jgi:PAT family beta-lactamase induction signal transducer AmpG
MSDTQGAAVPAERPEGWLMRSLRPYRKPEMAAMLMLGFASGLPLYLVYQKTSFWLREEGIELSTIGYFYWLGLFYTFKFVWAPIIDNLKVPALTERMGHRRSWMVTSIAGTVLGLVLIAGSDPSEGLFQIVFGAMILAFSGATLDVSIDAWRIESAPSEAQASMAASYSLGYRGALIFSGLSLVIAGMSSWFVSFLVMAFAMAATGALVFVIREPRHAEKKVDLGKLPLLAGPLQAIAVGLGLFLLAKVFVWMNLPDVLWQGLTVLAVGALLAGPLLFKGTRAAFSWRALIAGLGTAAVMSGWLVRALFDLPEDAQWAKLVVVLATIGLIGLTIAAVFAASRATGDHHHQEHGRLHAMFATPFLQVYDRFGRVLIPIFILVMIYRLSDFTMGVMAVPLYADLGFAKAVVGGVQSGPGVISTFAGFFLGGLAATTFGLTRSLVIGAVLTFLTNGFYAWFAAHAGGGDVGYLILAICADNVAGGFVTTVFIAYLSSLVDPANAATQYALFSSVYAILNKFVAGFSGAMAEAMGYEAFFLLTASYAIPAGILVLLVAGLQRRHPPKAIEGVPAHA